MSEQGFSGLERAGACASIGALQRQGRLKAALLQVSLPSDPEAAIALLRP